MGSYTLKKHERLKSSGKIASLFESGQSFLVYPVRVVWNMAPSEEPSQIKVAFAVSKRLIRTATHRNKLKRRLREAYRLNKYILSDIPASINLHCIFVFVGREVLSFAIIEKSMIKALGKIVKHIQTQELNSR